MKRCSKCAEKIQDKALVCRFCGAEQPALPKGGNRPLYIAIVAVIVVIFLASRCSEKLPADGRGAETLSPAAIPSDEPGGMPIPAVDAAEYVLLEAKELPNGDVTALSRRHSDESGSTFSYREYNCRNGTFRYLGSGDTREAAEVVRFGSDPFSGLVEGSSAYLTGVVACRKFNKVVGSR